MAFDQFANRWNYPQILSIVLNAVLLFFFSDLSDSARANAAEVISIRADSSIAGRARGDNFVVSRLSFGPLPIDDNIQGGGLPGVYPGAVYHLDSSGFTGSYSIFKDSLLTESSFGLIVKFVFDEAVSYAFTSPVAGVGQSHFSLVGGDSYLFAVGPNVVGSPLGSFTGTLEANTEYVFYAQDRFYFATPDGISNGSFQLAFGAMACGNNAVDSGEQCDDGNTESGDGCSAECQYEGCSVDRSRGDRVWFEKPETIVPCIIPLPHALWTKEFTNGERLELRCEGSPASYKLLHIRADGTKNRVAQCVFLGGANDGLVRYVQAADGSSRCLLNTEWENLDGNINDGQRTVDLVVNGNHVVHVVTGDEEPYLDLLEFDYDAAAQPPKLSWTNKKYPYPTSVPFVPQFLAGNYVSGQPAFTHHTDPEVGPETEALFDGVDALMALEPPDPMRLVVACDLNLDTRCNSADIELFNKALGTCEGESQFLRTADIDRNGCVNLDDEGEWLSIHDEFSGGCTRTQEYWKRHSDAWNLNALSLGTTTYSMEQLLMILRESVGGNGVLSLAQQLIAAKLNAASGALAPSAVIGEADTIIGTLVVPPVGSGFLNPASTSTVKDLLEAYNSGKTGPGSCAVTVPLAGDLNGDDVLDAADYQLIRSSLGKCTGATGFVAAADLDANGCVDYRDYQSWYAIYRASR